MNKKLWEPDERVVVKIERRGKEPRHITCEVPGIVRAVTSLLATFNAKMDRKRTPAVAGKEMV